jgi:hypothetical protein
MQFAEEKLSAMLERLNNFTTEDFAAYQEKVEAMEFSLFPEMKPIRME